MEPGAARSGVPRPDADRRAGPACAPTRPSGKAIPRLDDHNRSDDRVLLLPIRIERPPGAATPAIAHAAVEASFDDGETWVSVPIVRLGDVALGAIVHPPGATHVSLRGTAAEVSGNAVEQTIVRAYAIAATAD